MNIQAHTDNKIMMEMQEMLNAMNVVPMPGDPDHHYAMMMKMHHEGAINMANIEVQEGQDATIKKMAQQMIQKQKQEIATLQSFLYSHSPHAVNYDFNMKMEMCMDKMDAHSSHHMITGQIDHDFATLMIAHHRSAIDMSNLVMHYGQDPMIQSLARDIKEDQEIEIAEMERWLQEHP